jgi:UDP-N-acetyl-D-galactosamine dehydrogenase
LRLTIHLFSSFSQPINRLFTQAGKAKMAGAFSGTGAFSAGFLRSKLMMRKGLKVIDAKVLILGFTFKENCPDVRNTRVIDIYQELQSFDMQVDVYDPWVDPQEVMHEYGISVMDKHHLPAIADYSAVILAVAHEEFAGMAIEATDERVIFDVKSLLPKSKVDARL